MFDPELVQQIRHNPVVAVLVVDEVTSAVPLARALVAGGISIMELTLRTPAAIDALRAVRREVPEMTAGMGTILDREQVRDVKNAGAQFGVSPGLNPNVLEEARRQNLPFAPGVVTPSDIERALEFGCHVLKFFPAEASGGLAYLRSMAAPYEHLKIQFMPLGGLNAGNFQDYLKDPLVCAIGGSWIAPRQLIQEGNWGEIQERASTASAIVKQMQDGPARRI